MSEDPVLKYFELEYSGKADDVVPVYKYRAIRSGASIAIAHIEGPHVKGLYTLATEAHDDVGLPQALANVVYMGSEDYPYKNIVGKLTSRCLGTSTGGFIDTDHSWYRCYMAGSEGFLNLMPVYLDHILFPTLKESAYMTEIHHINGEGEDAGSMYCQLKDDLNGRNSRTKEIEMLKDMYPGHCGYKSVTDGVLKAFREGSSYQKVKSYHAEYYRPENLCIIVCGMVEPLDVLKTFVKFEEKIVSKPVDRPVYVRPWQSEMPPLTDSVERTVKYGWTAEHGVVTIGWRGPSVKDQVEMAGLMILFEYLVNSVNSPILKEFLMIEDPYCTGIIYSILEYSISCVYVCFDGVPLEKLQEIKPRLLKQLETLSESDDWIDMDRMQGIIRYQIREALYGMDGSPHYTVGFSLIRDFLYGDTAEDTNMRLNKTSILKDLGKMSASYWTSLMKKYLIDANYVAIIGEPSADLIRETEESEARRLTEQKERLKDELTERQKLLELAIKENEIEPPSELLLSIPKPDVSSISFHKIKYSCNYLEDLSMQQSEKFLLDEIPVSFQLDDICGGLLMMEAVIDSSGISEELRQYLLLYVEVVLESPILRDGTLISYEDVVKEIAEDTAEHYSSIGVHKYDYVDNRFECGVMSTCVILKLRVQMENYIKGVEWLHALLYDVQFDVEPVKVAISRIISDAEGQKRNGNSVAGVLLAHQMKVKGSNEYLVSMLRQQKFLTTILQKLDNDPDYAAVVLEKLNELKVELTDPARLRVHMSADVDRLVTQTGISDAVSVWSNVFLPSAQQKYRVESPPQRDYELQKPYAIVSEDSAPDNLIDCSMSLIIGVEGVDSSYLYIATPCLTEFRHPDIPAILLLTQYMTEPYSENGYMWKEMYLAEFAPNCRLTLKLDYGYLEFFIKESSKVLDAYRLAKKIVEEHSEGEKNFDAALMESCKSTLIIDTSRECEAACDVSRQSMLAYLRGIPHGYIRWLVERIPEVSADDMRRVCKLYFTSLFNPTQSKLSICTGPESVDEICQKFKTEFGLELTVVNSLEEPSLVNM